MNSILANHAIEDKGGFWARQLSGPRTPGQLVFDFVFGIVMPVFCFYLDPGIVRAGLFSPVGELSLFIYAFSGLAIIALFVWLVFGHRMGSLGTIFGGVLVAGAIVSTSIGVLILPLTLIGILVVIGLLGFVPFITGFVYLRNALRAINYSGASASRLPRFAIVVFSAVIAIALPGVAQWKVNDIAKQSTAEILDQNTQSIDAPVARIKRLRLVVDTDRFVREYEKESSPARKERLGRAYKEITGEEIERRLSILND